MEPAIDFYIFHEILDWFINDLRKNNIELDKIESAMLRVTFNFKRIFSKPKKLIIELELDLNATIETSEKQYKTNKKENKRIYVQ